MSTFGELAFIFIISIGLILLMGVTATLVQKTEQACDALERIAVAMVASMEAERSRQMKLQEQIVNMVPTALRDAFIAATLAQSHGKKGEGH